MYSCNTLLLISFLQRFSKALSYRFEFPDISASARELFTNLQELCCSLFVEQCATSFKLNELDNLASNWTLDHCLSC